MNLFNKTQQSEISQDIQKIHLTTSALIFIKSRFTVLSYMAEICFFFLFFLQKKLQNKTLNTLNIHKGSNDIKTQHSSVRTIREYT